MGSPGRSASLSPVPGVLGTALVVACGVASVGGCGREEVPAPAPAPAPTSAPIRGVPPDRIPGVIAAMNRGLGSMDQFDNGAAARELRRAVAAAPGFYPARYDLGLALTNLREDPAGAEEALRAALELEPGEPAPWFVLGFLLSRALKVPRMEEAVAAFRRAALLAPGDPDARLDLGVALVETGKVEEGIREIEESVRIAPRLGAAIYQRAMAYRAAGRDEEAGAELRRYAAMEHAGRVDIREAVHGYEGRLAEPVRDFGRWLPLAAPTEPARAELHPVEDAFPGGPPPFEPGAALAIGDLDGDGVLDIVLGGGGSGWRRGLGGCRFGPLVPFPGGARATGDLSLGDMDGDGRLAVVARGIGIVRSAGVEPRLEAHPSRDEPGRRLLADVDGDGRLDLVAGSTVWLNDGKGGLVPSPATPVAAGGDRLPDLLGDIDRDGFPDLLFLPAAPGERGSWLPNLREGAFATGLREIPAGLPVSSFPAGVLAVGDIDADGTEDAVVRTAAGAAALRRDWRTVGARRAETLLSPGPAESAVFADLDGDGDLDLVLAAGGRLLVLRNDGDAGPRMLALSLQGIFSPLGRKYGQANLRGIGTRVTVSTGRRCTTLCMGLEPAPTGKPPPDVLHFLVGAGGRADLVSLRWPEGLLQGETEVPAGRRTVVERQRKTNW